MKKYIPVLLITSLLLSACSIWNKDNLFEKKQECAKYKVQVEADIEKKCNNYNETSNCYLSEIYYNNQNNSCEYSWYVNYSTFSEKWEAKVSKWIYFVEDILTWKEIFSDSCDKENLDCSENLHKELSRIKWE